MPSATRHSLSELPSSTSVCGGSAARNAASDGLGCERLATTASGAPARAEIAQVAPSPVRVAPPPRRAAYVTPRSGACTTPRTGSPSCTSATLTVYCPFPAKNSRVPSSGSTSQKRRGNSASTQSGLFGDHQRAGVELAQRALDDRVGGEIGRGQRRRVGFERRSRAIARERDDRFARAQRGGARSGQQRDQVVIVVEPRAGHTAWGPTRGRRCPSRVYETVRRRRARGTRRRGRRPGCGRATSRSPSRKRRGSRWRT